MGFEIHTQPTIFLGPVSALGGFYPPTGTGTLSGEYTAFFKTWTFIGDGVTTRYSINSDQLVLPYSENFIVNIDGVMQTPSKYTIDAVYKFIDFNEPIPLDSELTIVQIATLATPEAPPIKYATFYHNWQYTGNGVTNTYSIPTTGVLVPDSENYIVTINGVVQTPTTYSIDTTNSLITLDTNVPDGSQLSITQIGTLRKDTFSVYSYDFNTWSFSISSTVSTLPLSGAPVDLSPKQGAYLVSIDGVTQAPGVDFTIDVNAQAINFTSPLLSGSLVRVQQLGSLGITIEDDIMLKYLSLSGGTISGNLLIVGALTALSGANFITTNFTTTSALSVVNSGYGPALYAQQTNTEPVLDIGNNYGSSIYVAGSNTQPGFVGINTKTPNEQLTIVGNVSALGTQTIRASSTSSALNVTQIGTGSGITLAGTQIINANSSSDGLRITQIGTGNALLVEDESNPDSTPFVITSGGRVGIGTSTPSTKLEVRGSVSIAPSGTYIKQFYDDVEEYILNGPDNNYWQPFITYLPSSGTSTRGFKLGAWNNDGVQQEWLRIWDGRVGIKTLSATPALPDTTLDIYSSQGSGTSHPHRVGLLVTGEGSSVGGRIGIRASTDVESPYLITYRSRGSVASPSAIQVGDTIGSWANIGYDGTSWASNNQARITFIASEDWSSTNHGSYITFTTNTSGAGGTTNERMRIADNGQTVIGNISSSGTIYPGSNVGFNPTLTANLQFTNAYGLSGKANKILLWPGSGPGLDGNYGFGIAANELSYLGENHIFYTPTNVASTSSVMIISNTGNVGIGANAFSSIVKPTKTLDVFGSVELSGTSSNSGTLFASPPLIERTNVIFGRANETTDIDVRTSNVWMFLSASNARWTHNIRGNSTTPLSSIMTVGDSLTLTLFSQQSSRSFFTSAIRIDNVPITPRWFNNSVPVSSVSLSGFDVYSWSIIKINDPSTYRVLGSISQFG